MIGERGHEAFYQDKRHTLYQEYLRLIRGHAPAVFVMENVKGLLSSRLNETLIFGQILKDLRRPKAGLEYRLMALSSRDAGLFSGCQIADQADPEAFILEAEDYGVPQARHRLIIVGNRRVSRRPRQPRHPSGDPDRAARESGPHRRGGGRLEERPYVR